MALIKNDIQLSDKEFKLKLKSLEKYISMMPTEIKNNLLNESNFFQTYSSTFTQCVQGRVPRLTLRLQDRIPLLSQGILSSMFNLQFQLSAVLHCRSDGQARKRNTVCCHSGKGSSDYHCHSCQQPC